MVSPFDGATMRLLRLLTIVSTFASMLMLTGCIITGSPSAGRMEPLCA
jgi:hypothetical protein